MWAMQLTPITEDDVTLCTPSEAVCCCNCIGVGEGVKGRGLVMVHDTNPQDGGEGGEGGALTTFFHLRGLLWATAFGH